MLFRSCRSVCRLGWISIDPNGFAVQLGSIESKNKSILVNSTRGISNRIYSTLGPPPLQSRLYPYPSPCIGTLPGGVTVHPPTCTRLQVRRGASGRDFLGSRSLWKRRQFVNRSCRDGDVRASSPGPHTSTETISKTVFFKKCESRSKCEKWPKVSAYQQKILKSSPK